MPNSDRWIYLIYCHSCGKEYRDSFAPETCDYCGSSDLSVAKAEGAEQ